MTPANTRLLAAALLLAGLAAAPAPAAAAKVNPDGSVAPAAEPAPDAKAVAEAKAKAEALANQVPNPAHPSVPDPAAGLRRAMEAQGDISPHTVRALQHDPKAMDAIGRGGAQQGGAAAKPEAVRNTKAIYGDIIVHK